MVMMDLRDTMATDDDDDGGGGGGGGGDGGIHAEERAGSFFREMVATRRITLLFTMGGQGADCAAKPAV